MKVAWLLAIAALLGCGGEEAEPDAAEVGAAPEAPNSFAIVSVALIDPQPWTDLLESGTRYRLEIGTTAGTDTIPEIAIAGAPIVVGGSKVEGFSMEADGSIPSGFIYDARARELQRVELPPDFLYFTAFALRPTGGHIAYVGRADDGVSLAAIVRRWPDGELVFRSGPVDGYPSDDANSSVTWLSGDSVDIRIRLSEIESEAGTWLRVSGSPDGAFVADTVPGGGG